MPPEPVRASVPSAAFLAAAAAFPGLNSWRGALRLAMGLFALSMLNTQIHGPGNSISYGAYRWVNAGFLVRPAASWSDEAVSTTQLTTHYDHRLDRLPALPLRGCRCPCVAVGVVVEGLHSA